MPSQSVKLSIPAAPEYARPVRMLAASLAAGANLSVDDVEDVRMAAEEGFVYACSTKLEVCDIVFTFADDAVLMDFSLGEEDVLEPEDQEADGQAGQDPLAFVELLLAAVCDEFVVSEEGPLVLHLVKRTA